MSNPQLAELAEAIGAEGVVTLIDIFMSDTPEMVNQALQADTNSDEESLRRCVHTLKSSARYLGAERLAEVCDEMEQMIRDGQFNDARGRIPELNAAADESLSELTELRPGYLEQI